MKEMHYTVEVFWFSAYGCGVDTGSTTNSVSETCVLTEVSNSVVHWGQRSTLQWQRVYSRQF